MLIPHQVPPLYGYVLTTSNSMGASNFNSANVRNAFFFIANRNATLSSVLVRVASTSGSPQRQDLILRIHADNNGTPGSALTAERNAGTGSLTANTTYEVDFSSDNLTLSFGTPYWVIIRNGNSNPSSNSFWVTHGFDVSAVMWVNAMRISYAVRASTDGGSTWDAGTPGRYNAQIRYSNGARVGVIGISASNTILSTSTINVRHTLPSGLGLNVIGIGVFNIVATGSPGTYYWELQDNQGQTIATTAAHNLAGITGIVNWFDSVVQLQAGSEVRAYFRVNNPHDSSNRYGVRIATLDSSNLPDYYAGQNFVLYSGNTEQSGDRLSFFWFILDPEQPFTVSGGGSIPLPPHAGFITIT